MTLNISESYIDRYAFSPPKIGRLESDFERMLCKQLHRVPNTMLMHWQNLFWWFCHNYIHQSTK